MLDLIWKQFWLRPIMAIAASVHPESSWIRSAGSDFLHPVGSILVKKAWIILCKIQSVPFLQRRSGSYCAKPGWIQSGWPGKDSAKCISSRSKPMCKNHWAWFWQNTTGLLPVSHFRTTLHFSTDCSFRIVQNQPGSRLVLADCVKFWPNRSGPEASQCARIIRPTSGQSCLADPDQM